MDCVGARADSGAASGVIAAPAKRMRADRGAGRWAGVRGAAACRARTIGSVAVAIVATVALLAPASADAASPVLEFVAPGHGLPVSVETESGQVKAQMQGSTLVMECASSRGEGEIVGPRTVLAEYQFSECNGGEPGKKAEPCQSADAKPEEITTGKIEAKLVFIDQAKDEVGMLLNPGGGPTQPYIVFECGGIEAKGFGPFLSPGSPINEATTTFTMALHQDESTQTPDAYEGEEGEPLEAVPTGEQGKKAPVPTGVEMTVTVHTSSPIEVKALTAQQVEAKQHEAEAAAAKKHEEEATAAAAKKREEEATAAAAKKQEEEAADKKRQAAAEAKKREEETTRREHEEAKQGKAKRLTRLQQLRRALKACKKQPKRRRAQCAAQAHRRYRKTKAKGKAGRRAPTDASFALDRVLSAVLDQPARVDQLDALKP
jgi:chemotaxis protein histidine kinase CheA